ncbi:hypothetical protein DL89DRAFT_316175, partial [Linderina pennispora]
HYSKKSFCDECGGWQAPSNILRFLLSAGDILSINSGNFLQILTFSNPLFASGTVYCDSTILLLCLLMIATASPSGMAALFLAPTMEAVFMQSRSSYLTVLCLGCCTCMKAAPALSGVSVNPVGRSCPMCHMRRWIHSSTILDSAMFEPSMLASFQSSRWAKPEMLHFGRC